MNNHRNTTFKITNPNPPEKFGYHLAKVFVEVHADKLKQAVVDKHNELHKS